MRNLFSRLHECRIGDEESRFGSGWEDLFTEQFGFYLSCDLSAAHSLAGALLDEPAATVSEVETWRSFESDSPDMVLGLEDGRLLLLEHKVEASLQPRQLERYLQHGLVALVSRGNLNAPRAALEHDDYLQPTRGEHYSWEDVFRALPSPEDPPSSQRALREAFRSYMRELGFAPSNLTSKWRRLFRDRTEEENRRVQEEFGRLLNGVKAYLREGYDLEVQDVSYKGKQGYAPAGTTWRHLYVNPRRLQAEEVPKAVRSQFGPGYEALTVDVVFDEEQDEEARELADRLPSSYEDSSGHRWHRIGILPISQHRLRVTVATPLSPFFEDEDGLGERLDTASRETVDLVLGEVGLSSD